MKKQTEEYRKFEEEFGVLLHMFRDNQSYFELITYRDYGKNKDMKLIILYTNRYGSTSANEYLHDDGNKLQNELQDWNIKHVNIHARSNWRIRLEIVLYKE